MADERLGASFSIDITNLKAGLSQANRLIRESQSEFKAAAAGLDDWTKSEEGLNAKIKSLTDVTEIQKKKVGALKTEYKNLIDNGLDPTSKQAVDLRTKINNEEAALASNEKELKKQKEALQQVGKESEDAGEKAEQSGKDAEEGGKGWQKFGDFAKAAAKVAATAIAAATAAVGALVKEAVESYASYEQLVGGVDTLFGESSQKVQDYAANAYKTAGMSANEYMETVTSFSASLLQSLGGDTEKAAEVADMAITDMSDNANKMGTDMESIQNAYNGFAKGNFTMLDNLKLGYGGTQEEMKRLLADAEKISGVKYDISSYADVTQAIHVMQEEMGIAGTTAKEASTTIEGSVSSMKSAYSNLLTGLADDNANMGMLIENVIESALTVADNLIPRVLEILDKIPEAISMLLPEIPPILNELLPPLIEAVGKVIEGVVEVLPQIIDSIVALLPTILSALLDMLPAILEAAIEIVVAIVDGVADMLPTIVDAILELLPKLIDALVKSIPQLLEAAIKLLMAIVDAIPTIVTALVDALPTITSSIVETLLESLPILIEAAIELFMALVQAIPQINAELAKALPQIITGIVQGLLAGGGELVEAGGSLLENLLTPFEGVGEWFSNVGTKISEAFSAAWDSIKQSAADLWEGVKEIFSVVIGWVKENIVDPIINSTLFKIVSELAEGCWIAIKAIWGVVSAWFNENIITPVTNFFTDLWNAIKDKAIAAWNGIKEVFITISGWINDNIIQPVTDFFDDMWNNFSDKASAAWDKVKEIFSAVAEYFGNIFSEAWEKVKSVFSTGGKIFAGIVDGITEAFKNIVNKIIQGINKVIAVPFNAINAVLDRIRDVDVAGIQPFSGLITRINVPEIPQLAEGGVVRGATTAVVGEDGAEAIVPLERNREWIKAVAEELAANQKQGVVINQTNNYSQAHSRLELYKSKQQTAAAVRLALGAV